VTAELRRYLAHFAPFWPQFVVAGLLMVLDAAIPGAAVVLLQRTLDKVVAGDGGGLGLNALALAGLSIASAVAEVVRTRITKGVAWQVTSDLRRALHARFLLLSPEQQGATGERVAALTHDVDELQYGVSALVTAFRNPLTIVGLAITAVTMAPGLAVWTLALVPAVLIPTRWGGQRLRALGKAMREARTALVRAMQEQLLGLRTIHAFAAEPGEIARFAAAEERDRSARLAMEVERVIPGAIVEVLAAVGLSVLLFVGGRQVLAGTLAPGALVGFAVALALMSRPLSGLSEVWSLMQRSLAALEKVYATMDTLPVVVERADAVELPSGPIGVRWDAVTVDYGNGPVVHAVDLEVEPGETLALVGATGEGKSSLLHLVARHRDATSGAVHVGGIDVRDAMLASLRRAVAVVGQDGFLFARTVAENVALGRPDAPRDEVEDALRIAGAARFVAALPQGMDTPLDELGRRLSGGERQRLCLARALVTRAPILLLDEATNQVDAETEAAILDALAELRRTPEGRTRTIVVVAHNLSAVRPADRIAVVERGRIVEQGTWDELVALRGRFWALAVAQGRRDVA
jgi:subfamily B ATP-binding cassette protein MsbA